MQRTFLAGAAALACLTVLALTAQALVVAPAPIGIDERLVGRENLPEAIGGLAVTGIDVGVQPPGQASVRTLDLAHLSATFDAKHDVEIHSWPAVSSAVCRLPGPRLTSCRRRRLPRR